MGGQFQCCHISVTDSRGNTYRLQGTDLTSTVHQVGLVSGYISTALHSGDTITITWSTAATLFGGTIIAMFGRDFLRMFPMLLLLILPVPILQ